MPSNEPHTLPLEISYSEINTSCVIIDCRKPEEFEEGHIRNAHNIPLQHISISKECLPCSQNDHVLVYCRTGNRSLTFATFLRSIGYLNCQSISGGYELFKDKL